MTTEDIISSHIEREDILVADEFLNKDDVKNEAVKQDNRKYRFRNLFNSVK